MRKTDAWFIDFPHLLICPHSAFGAAKNHFIDPPNKKNVVASILNITFIYNNEKFKIN